MYSLMTRHVLVVLVGVAAAVAPHASQALTLEDFRSMPDNRIAVRTSLGVRSVRPLGPSQVELVLGLSSTPAAENPLAWRVVSNDDPDYAYEKFVCPSKAGVKKAVEAEGPDGCPFPKFETRVVTLDLPTPMKEGKSYDFIAQGVNGGVAVGGHAAQGVLYKETGNYPVPDNALDLAVIGLRRVEQVSRALYVGGIDIVLMVERERGGGMDYGVMVTHHTAHSLDVADIALHDVYPRLLGIVELGDIEGSDVFDTLAVQVTDQIDAEKTRPAGDKNVHRMPPII